MAGYAFSRLRFVALALATLAFTQVTEAVTVVAPAASSFFLNGLKGQAPTTRKYNFEITEMNGSPDGYSKPMLVVNGQWPGPTIEANQGDRLQVTVTNKMSSKTTVHYHGLLQNGTHYWDGVQGVSECGIPPGESLTYDFPIGTFTGTTWWQNANIDYDAQYSDGISGALIVHNTDPAPAGFPAWDQEVVLQLSDVYHRSSGDIIQDYMTGAASPLVLETPDSGSINGVGQYGGKGGYFDLDLQPNKTYRLRLIHTGSAANIRFSIDNHPLTVIEADGTLLQPYTVAGVNMVVGQRYSVLLTTNQASGPHWMRLELESPTTIPGATTDVRGVIRYGTTSTSLPANVTDPGIPGSSDLDISKLFPAVKDLPPARSKFYMSNFSLVATSTGGGISYMNGTSWQPLQGTFSLLEVKNTNGTWAPEGSSVQNGDQFVITEDTIQTVDLLLVNEGLGDHPFHLHGHRPWIMGYGSGSFDGHELTPANPLRRDTFDIPSQGWIMIRYISDNPGPWTLHCHNAWHMAVGMLLQLNNLPSVAAKLAIPQAIIDQCKYTGS